MKGRVAILVRDRSSFLVLHFYQVPSKYSKRYSNYSADTKTISNKTKGDNSKSKRARVVILVHDMSSYPVLHFYRVSAKYSQGYSSYRADKKFYADADPDAHANKIICSPTLWWGGGGGVGGRWGGGDIIKYENMNCSKLVMQF